MSVIAVLRERLQLVTYNVGSATATNHDRIFLKEHTRRSLTIIEHLPLKERGCYGNCVPRCHSNLKRQSDDECACAAKCAKVEKLVDSVNRPMLGSLGAF